MSLSRFYKSLPTFEPGGIVRDKVDDDQLFQRTAHRPKPPAPVKEDKEHRQQLPSEPEPESRETVLEEFKQEVEQAPAPPTPEPAVPQGIPEEEVQRLVAEAREQGLAEGLEKAENDFGSASSAMLLICNQLDELRELILKNSVGEIRELVLAISEKIIRHSVSEQRETIFRTIDEAISRSVKSDDFLIFVNPADYDTIIEKTEDLRTGLSGMSNLTVKADPSVDEGGCRIESDKCTVDATIVSQLELIREALTEELEP
ncbi:FliH/SctL family protein [Desulfopila sp. IMCC35008]|uniref:FliH/SctL family protein n=1 Tax=Desulfopila sp. IMCC35008 TaxID=2653858 RepID=UPI0013D6DFAC|nr:FliH/SctL family protein [Desulfopila sp. IMCC35008]